MMAQKKRWVLSQKLLYRTKKQWCYLTTDSHQQLKYDVKKTAVCIPVRLLLFFSDKQFQTILL
ncbi:hypothetical protein M2135_001281 [Parabacteroides sp. PF5-9]|nr:hypothetical protein [Parabacteroides sp. PF5-9]